MTFPILFNPEENKIFRAKLEKFCGISNRSIVINGEEYDPGGDLAEDLEALGMYVIEDAEAAEVISEMECLLEWIQNHPGDIHMAADGLNFSFVVFASGPLEEVIAKINQAGKDLRVSRREERKKLMEEIG